MKTADLAEGYTYAFVERSTSDVKAALLLDLALWWDGDQWANWDGGEKRTRARVVRKAPKGSRVARSKSWGDYFTIGLPFLVLEVWDFSFSERAGDDRITEDPHAILERARDAMNVMDLVAENHDGRSTERIHSSITLRVPTAKGVARKVTVSLMLARPQQISTGWTTHVETAEREAAAKAATAKRFAEAATKSRAQGQDFVSRITALMGDGDTVRYDHSDERYDFHREWTSSGMSSTYQVSAEVIARLLDLAEKGASA